MEPVEKTTQDYIREVANRFGQLSQEEAQSLLELYGTPQLVTISKILGPEVSSVLGDAMNQIARAAETPAQAPAPMSKGGLVAKRKKPVAKKK